MSEYNVKEAQRQVEGMLNSFSYRGRINEFNELMLNSHRTLQQSYTKLCLDWLRKMSVQESFDMRNKASVDIAKVAMEAIGNDINLPMI